VRTRAATSYTGHPLDHAAHRSAGRLGTSGNASWRSADDAHRRKPPRRAAELANAAAITAGHRIRRSAVMTDPAVASKPAKHLGSTAPVINYRQQRCASKIF
jgi:hypothetical protein